MLGRLVEIYPGVLFPVGGGQPSMDTGPLRLATRGSALARRQAAIVTAALEEHRYDVELVEIETTGDRVRDELIHRLGKTGAFVRSLDEQVLAEEVDGAIHSMKDMPTESPADLIVAGIPERADPADVLVTPSGDSLADLPDGATVGTSSLRRAAQLRAQRENLVVEPLRGNVDTRIEKLLAPSLQREHQLRLDAATHQAETDVTDADSDDVTLAEEGSADGDPETNETVDDEPADTNYKRSVEEWFDDLTEIERRALERQPDIEYDAIVLAAAGLDRSGLAEQVPTASLSLSSFIPAPGQGAIAVTAVDGSDASEALNDAIDHPRTRVETTTERVVLGELGGGCVAPIGVYALVKGEYVHVDAAVYDREGQRIIDGHRDLPVENYVEAARAFAGELRDRGAAELIAEVTAEDNSSEAKRS